MDVFRLSRLTAAVLLGALAPVHVVAEGGPGPSATGSAKITITIPPRLGAAPAPRAAATGSANVLCVQSSTEFRVMTLPGRELGRVRRASEMLSGESSGCRAGDGLLRVAGAGAAGKGDPRGRKVVLMLEPS